MYNAFGAVNSACSLPRGVSDRIWADANCNTTCTRCGVCSLSTLENGIYNRSPQTLLLQELYKYVQIHTEHNSLLPVSTFLISVARLLEPSVISSLTHSPPGVGMTTPFRSSCQYIFDICRSTSRKPSAADASSERLQYPLCAPFGLCRFLGKNPFFLICCRHAYVHIHTHTATPAHTRHAYSLSPKDGVHRCHWEHVSRLQRRPFCGGCALRHPQRAAHPSSGRRAQGLLNTAGPVCARRDNHPGVCVCVCMHVGGCLGCRSW